MLTVFPRLAEMVSRRAGKLSGGERKMLAMGRVLMLSPALVVLDEPTANLAPQIAVTVLEEHVRQLAAHRRVGAGRRAAGASGAARSPIAPTCMGGGQLRMEGTPAELASSPEFVDSFLGGGSRVA